MINKSTTRYKREGRYSTWWLTVLHQASLEIDMDVVEEVCNRLFEEYKMCLTEEDNEDVVVVIGKTKIRKRFSTLSKQISNELMDALERVGDSPSTYSFYSFRLDKSDYSYRSTKLPSNEVLSSSSEVSEYEGEDIRMLDDPSKRTPWQVSLLGMIYDESTDDFKKPDDRTIIWIHDKVGSVGKSKFVKWMCVNGPAEVRKISFGTTNQLRSSIISSGPAKVYCIDVPRTIGKQDKIEDLISVTEDIKNGHVVSNFYGRYGQLLMNPPHIIYFSNQRCPVNMMSKDRWKSFTINGLEGDLVAV